MNVRVLRVRILPVVGYWEQCQLIVVLHPDERGVCACYSHFRTDLTLEQAKALQQRILEAGVIVVENGWSPSGIVRMEHLVDI